MILLSVDNEPFLLQVSAAELDAPETNLIPDTASFRSPRLSASLLLPQEAVTRV